MAGFNNYLEIHVFYILYWLTVTAVILFAFLLVKNQQKFSRSNATIGGIISLIIAVVTANTIHNQTVFSEHYIPYNLSSITNGFRDNYIRTYDQLSEQRYPKVRLDNIAAKIEIYPYKEKLNLSGVYQLTNTGNSPITNLVVTLPPFVKHINSSFNTPLFAPTKPELYPDINLINYQFKKALQPGEKTEYHFEFSYRNLKGTTTPRLNNKITQDYTYIENTELFPLIGGNHNYFAMPTLNAFIRPTKSNNAKTDINFNNSFFQKKVNHMTLELVTNHKQTAVSSGKLTKQRIDGERSHYFYRSDQVQKNYFPIISAPYVKTQIQADDLEVISYALPQFKKNSEFINHSALSILQYYRKLLGFTPRHQVTLLQRPIDSGLSRTFPGLITLSNKYFSNVDLIKSDNELAVFRLLAHEVAHLWFGHHLVTGQELGARSLIERLSQFMTHIAVKKLRQTQQFERSYQFDVNRYKKYHRHDKPLLISTSQDIERFLTYYKSSLLFYGLSQRLSEDKFFSLLKNYLTSIGPEDEQKLSDFSAFLKQHTTAELSPAIDEVFSRAIHYDFAIHKLSYERQDKQYKLEVFFTINRNEKPKKNLEPEISTIDMILLIKDEQAKETVIKLPLETGQQGMSILLNNKPISVEIDPDHWYLDIDRSNNNANFSGSMQ